MVKIKNICIYSLRLYKVIVFFFSLKENIHYQKFFLKYEPHSRSTCLVIAKVFSGKWRKEGVSHTRMNVVIKKFCGVPYKLN